MRRAAYLVVFLCCCSGLIAQQTTPSLTEITRKAALRPAPVMRQVTPATEYQGFPLKNPGVATARPTVQQVPGEPANALSGKGALSLHRPNAPCEDSSFRWLMGIENGYIFVQSVTQSKDGGMLVSAMMHDTTLLPNPWWKSFGLLIKLDANGNIQWLKRFEDLTPASYHFFAVMRAFELDNGDIICSAFLSHESTINAYRTMIFRLSAAGDILWRNCLQSDLAVFNSPKGTFTFWLESAADGLNGDVILCGTSNSNLSSGKIETVVRLDNTGKKVWDANYGNHGADGSYLFGSEGISAFMQNGEIMLVGLSHGTNYPETAPAVNFLRLNYNNGALLSRRFFKPAAGFEKWFTYWGNKFTRLANGHFLFYGKLFSDFMHTAVVKDHFAVIEFDAGFNLVDAYTVSSGLATNYYNSVMHFDASGRGLVSLLEYIDVYASNVFFASIKDRQARQQRKMFYDNTGLPGNNGFSFLGTAGYGFVQSYFENLPATKSYIEFRKMHDSDTSSGCLGRDTQLLRFYPLDIIEDPSYYYLDPNDPNAISEANILIRQTDLLSTSRHNPCQQSNFCDTLKIHGNPSICGDAPYVDFSAFKNKECGATVLWSVSNDAIDSLLVLSDTSARFWFKKGNWRGELRASLSEGECYRPAADILSLNITRSTAHLDLGSDTVICDGQTLTLHAGKEFAAYRWQDGSTDPVFSVSTDGRYWVTSIDHCGNTFSDTIVIWPLAHAVDLGPDRVKCNNDTIHLAAPPGYINYTWSNDYRLQPVSATTVAVDPLVDTSYYLRAEKSPGCFAYDTVHIKVAVSPPIFLGADTSFCSGNKLVLKAGNGFDSYRWSDGSSGESIDVYNEGRYTVKGTWANGCSSHDTLQVLHVWPGPAVSLDNNPQLCQGSSRRLQPGLFESYRWQDGSTSPVYEVNDTGWYHVTVTDSHQCMGSDTVHIMQLVRPPQDFLPPDTIICNYTSLRLAASLDFTSYQWSNQATSPSIIINRPGTYWLEVTDGNGCSGKDDVLVGTRECLDGFYIPGAFTPDNNGLNDQFRPIIGGMTEMYRFTIYNRWGQIVFTTTEPLKGWDGKYGNLLQPTGVFAWTCTFRLTGQSTKTESGKVVLVR